MGNGQKHIAPLSPLLNNVQHLNNQFEEHVSNCILFVGILCANLQHIDHSNHFKAHIINRGP